MKIISWNTNGLRATVKQGHFDPLFAQTNPDILCLQETKCEKEQLPLSIQEYAPYYSYFSHSKHKKGYSGVGVFTKILPQKVLYGMGISKFDDEGRLLFLFFKKGDVCSHKKAILINGYFPNGGSGPDRLVYKLEFYAAFLECIDTYKKKGYAIIFTGDINTAHAPVDLARPKANQENTGFLPIERAWIDDVVSHGYKDTFRTLYPDTKDAYTYWDQKTASRTRNVGWRIDYFFVSKDILPFVKDSSMLSDYSGSDHCPIVLTLAQ
jgi:exodeoxyribonuclease III